MISESKKGLLLELKDYISATEEKERLESKLYKLKGSSKPSAPNPPKPINPTIKMKELTPQDSKQFHKFISLCIAEIALAIFLIFCLFNSFNKGLVGFGGLVILLATPASIVALIVLGLKIKGMSSCITIKKENDARKQYNKKHEREIEEALQSEKNRYEKETEQYNVTMKEYEIALEKYNQEVIIPMKEMEEKISKLELTIQYYKKRFEEGVGRKAGLGEKFYTSSSDMIDLFNYYITLIEKNNECNIDSLESLINEVSCHIIKLVDDKQDGEEDGDLVKILDMMLRFYARVSGEVEHLNARAEANRRELEEIGREIEEKEHTRKMERMEKEAQRKREEKEREKEREEERRQKRKLEEARNNCYHCKHYNTCTVKGRVDCPMYVIKL